MTIAVDWDVEPQSKQNKKLQTTNLQKKSLILHVNSLSADSHEISRSMVAQWQSAWLELSSFTGDTELCPLARHFIHCFNSTEKTQEDLSQHNWKIVYWGVKNQTKQAKHEISCLSLLHTVRIIGD